MLEKIDLDWSQRLCSSIGDRCACRLATDWPHCATKIVLVFFGKCLAREDCSGLVTKIVLVDWRRIGRLATSKILNKLILNKLLHVHYVKSVDSLTAITGFAWVYDRTH